MDFQELVEIFPSVANSIFETMDENGLKYCKRISTAFRRVINGNRKLCTRFALGHSAPKYRELWSKCLAVLDKEQCLKLCHRTFQWCFLKDEIQSPIFYAVRIRDSDIFEKCWTIYCQIGIDTEEYFGLIKYTLGSGDDAKIFATLINSGMQVLSPEDLYEKYLDQAIILKRKEICKFLAKKYLKDNMFNRIVSPLHLAAVNVIGIEMYQAIAQQFSYQNLPDENGVTPLHLAAEIDNFPLFKFIFKTARHKNPVAWYKDHERYLTPLQIAALNNDLQFCQFILKNASRVEIHSDVPSFHPLHAAISCSNATLFRLFLDYFEDKNPYILQGYSALHIAAIFGHIRIIHMILEYVRDVNIRGPHGNTPLHCAVQEENFVAATILFDRLSYHGETQPRNDSGKTPLDYVNYLKSHKKSYHDKYLRHPVFHRI